VSRIRKLSLKLPVAYTDEEIAAKRDELATLVLAESDIRERKASAVRVFKEELENLIGRRREVAQQIRQRTIDLLVDCRVELHTPTPGTKRTTRLDTGSWYVKSR
jgi:hypothetical protein